MSLAVYRILQWPMPRTFSDSRPGKQSTNVPWPFHTDDANLCARARTRQRMAENGREWQENGESEAFRWSASRPKSIPIILLLQIDRTFPSVSIVVQETRLHARNRGVKQQARFILSLEQSSPPSPSSNPLYLVPLF